MNNPFEMLKMIKNPKQFVMNIVQKNSNPIFNNLVEMANNNDIEGLKKFGENLYSQKGKDFDKELQDFMDNFK